MPRSAHPRHRPSVTSKASIQKGLENEMSSGSTMPWASQSPGPIRMVAGSIRMRRGRLTHPAACRSRWLGHARGSPAQWPASRRWPCAQQREPSARNPGGHRAGGLERSGAATTTHSDAPIESAAAIAHNQGLLLVSLPLLTAGRCAELVVMPCCHHRRHGRPAQRGSRTQLAWTGLVGQPWLR